MKSPSASDPGGRSTSASASKGAATAPAATPTTTAAVPMTNPRREGPHCSRSTFETSRRSPRLAFMETP
ncbi:MAG: hypothetical protein ACLSDQ_03215 [Adlercreutzia equolifaciens]